MNTSLPKQAAVAPVATTLTDADFRFIAELIHTDAGIHLSPSKHSLVASRLARRLRVLSLPTFRDYCTLLAGADGAGERRHLLSALTTNVTGFFREPHHFEQLRQRVLPPLIEKARAGGRVRFWSAGCSTGEEPFSIALTILSMASDAAALDIKVLATDIDPVVLGHARAGTYPEPALASIPPDIRRNHVLAGTKGRETWSFDTRVRDLVAFRELNLTRNWPFSGPFDAIFCRNVVIYFDEETRSSLWNRFAALTPPGGWLFIGHSERLTDAAAADYASQGVTMYQRLHRK